MKRVRERTDYFFQFFGDLEEHRLLIFGRTLEDIKPHELEMVLAFGEWDGVVLPEEPHPIGQETSKARGNARASKG